MESGDIDRDCDMNRVYHERQSRQLCALHVLNNLFQEPNAFVQSSLDGICHELAPGTWINPHKSLLGLGNYDVNVLMSALQSRGYEAKWFDKRKPLSILVVENIFGFVLNVPSNFRVVGIVPLPFLKQKHWIALKSVGSSFYNLDSNLKKPEELGKVNEFLAFLEIQLKSDDKELFVVVKRNVAEDQSWRNDLTP